MFTEANVVVEFGLKFDCFGARTEKKGSPGLDDGLKTGQGILQSGARHLRNQLHIGLGPTQNFEFAPNQQKPPYEGVAPVH